MKKYRSSSVLFVLLFITLLFGILTIDGVSSATTIDYTFERDILYSDDENPLYDTTFNMRNQTTFTGHYPATYSFENEIDGTENLEIDYIDSILGTETTKIIPLMAGHEKVIELYDNSSDSYCLIVHYFESKQISETIEFWWRTSDSSKGSYVSFDSLSLSRAITLRLLSNEFQYESDGYHTIQSGVSDIWYHHKIIFDCNTDTMNWYINGLLEGEGVPFSNEVDDINLMRHQTPGGDIDFYTYFDAIGYSWDKTSYRDNWFDLSGEGNEPLGITWDGTHFWVVDDSITEVSQYSNVGVYTDVHFDVGSQDIYPMGLVWDGTYFWMVGLNTEEVYQYTSAGVYTSVHFVVGVQDIEPMGITWDGSYFWVVGKNTAEVYQYTVEGVYTNTHFDVGSQDNNPSDITWDGTHFWVLGYDEQEVYQYTSVGVYTGVYFDVGDTDVAQEGIVWVDGSFWLTGLINVKAYEYIYVETPYNIGDNMIPLIETNSSIQEFDRYEFAFEGTNDLFDNGDDNPNGWNDIEGGGGDQVNCKGNGIVEILNSADYDPGTGLQLTGRYITGERINVSFGFELIDLTSVISSHLDIYLDSSDNTEIIRTFIDKDGDLGYYDSEDDKVNLNDDMIEGVFYEFNFFIHYEIDLCILRYFADGVFIDAYVFPLKDEGKEGLRDIVFELEASTSGHQVDLDYVGIYKNGRAMAEGWGYLTYELNADWDFENQNLFMIDAKGLFSIQAVEGSYEHEESMDEIIDYDGFDEFRTLNLYDIEGDYDDCTLVFFFLSFWVVDSFYRAYIYDFNSLNIEGVNMTDGVNDYDLIYTHGYINVDESYFYVDSSNRLQFNLIVNNDNLEYIQAFFDIQNIATENRSIRFYSNINGNSKGYFALDYESEVSTTIQFPYSAKATNVILTQTESIESFTILITDNDKDNDDLCEGYIMGIRLIYYPDLATTITSLNLLAIIVPLIILIAPPMALQKKFGSRVILPMFILMAIVCVATELIPVWLFFIIAFASIGFIVLKEKVEVSI